MFNLSKKISNKISPKSDQKSFKSEFSRLEIPHLQQTIQNAFIQSMENRTGHFLPSGNSILYLNLLIGSNQNVDSLRIFDSIQNTTFKDANGSTSLSAMSNDHCATSCFQAMTSSSSEEIQYQAAIGARALRHRRFLDIVKREANPETAKNAQRIRLRCFTPNKFLLVSHRRPLDLILQYRHTLISGRLV